MFKRFVDGFLGDRVDEDLDECYPLRPDVDVTLASKFRPRKNKRLSREKWEAAFDANGRLVGLDSVLDSVRRGGVDPHIRGEVWEFLLGVFEPTSTAAERAALRRARRELYSNLKSECNLVDPVVGSGLVVDFPRVREDGSDIPVPAHSGDNSLLESLDMSGDGAGLASSVPSMLQHSAHFVRISPLDGSTHRDEDRTFTETRQAALERAGEDKVIKWRLGLHQIGVDVMRADRTLQFFEDEGNRARLMDVLAMYSWFDSAVGYCQGMGDLMSPMIVLFDNNADAFWCFERLMRKVRKDFIGTASSLGVQAEITKMAEALQWMQPELYIHLDSIGASSLFFTVRAIMTMFRRELSFADSLYLWEMEFAWEYDFQEVARLASRDSVALRSVSRDPFKGSSRETYLESEDEYAFRKELARGQALAAERGNACDSCETGALAACEALEEKEEPGTSSMPHALREREGEGEGDDGGHGEGSRSDYDLCMVSGPLTAGEIAAVARHSVEKEQRRQTAGSEEAATNGEPRGGGAAQRRGTKLFRNDSLRSNEAEGGRPSEAEKQGQARGERVPGGKSYLPPPRRQGTTSRSLTKDALSRALSEYKRRPSNRRPPKLAEAGRRASIKATFRRLQRGAEPPSGEAQGQRQGKGGARGTKELGRRSSVKKGAPPRTASAAWKAQVEVVEKKMSEVTRADLSRRQEEEEGGSEKLSRLSTFCVLAVLCHARNDLLTCDGMDDVVDVFNEHAIGWEVKELVKAAHEHLREYKEYTNSNKDKVL